MRNRIPKNLEKRVQKLSKHIIEEFNPNPDKETYIEIGSGKGLFLNTLAVRNPDHDYIGIEGQKSALLRCLEKADALVLDNISFYSRFIKDIRDHLGPETVSGIYLNFSDPWPKDRHAKRRLTNRLFQEGYHEALKDGFIEFKTDNDDFFSYSINEFNKAPYFEIVEMTDDLHHSCFGKDNVMTEYEEKFSARGKNINYLKAVKKLL